MTHPVTRSPLATALLAAALMALVAVWLAAPSQGQTAGQTVSPAAAGPTQIVGGIAPVGPGNTRPGPARGMLNVLLTPDPAQARKPILRQNIKGPAAEFLRARAARGHAAGMAGILYDNRDRGHSSLKTHQLPQINVTHHAEVFRRQGLDYGIAGPFRFPMPTIGNSSTALTKGPFRRSQARIAVHGQAAARRAFDLYAANHFYIYPEHRDHDPATGDLFFANPPLFMVSQGSSGSDRPILWTAAMTLAALRPDTFEALKEAGLIAPTLQMLLRMNRPAAQGGAAYLTGAAHPTAFDGEGFDLLGAMRQASALAPDAIPPLVRLRVEEDFATTPGEDYLDPDRSEAIFTTPAAIARAWRAHDWEREIALSAEDTVDPNGRPLVFDWVVLRGDPARIRIAHDPDDTARARIRIAWHDAYPVPGAAQDAGRAMTTSRVDIGVFASNGATISAPSILSVVFPVHQRRRYAPGPDGAMRLAEIAYDGGGGPLDPALWALANWRDSYDHALGAPLARITRRYGDGTEAPLAQGLRGLTRVAPDGTHIPVAHVPFVGEDGVPRLSDGLRPSRQDGR